MKIRLTALVLALTGVSVADASEWTFWSQAGPWKIETNGSICITGGSYKNGTTLMFSLNAQGVAAISFLRNDWNIPEGEYPVTIDFDGRGLGTYRASGKNNLVIADFEFNENFMRNVSLGNVMSARIGAFTYQYKLTNTKRMMPELIRCAAATTPSSGGGGNPFANSFNPFQGDRVLPSKGPFD